MQHKREHETLVTRLRRPLTDRSTEAQIQDKWNAISEALAYLIDKKHAKQKTKKARRKTIIR